jgi:uncharacterized protein (TIGR02466 family)
MIRFSEHFPTLIASDNNSKLAAEILPFIISYLDYTEKVYSKTCDITGKLVSEGLKDIWGYRTSYRPDYPAGFQELKNTNAIKPLNEYVILKSLEFLLKFGYTKETCKKLFISQMFANEMFRGESHPVHRHPRAIVSGVFYLQVPEGSSPIVFHDPRPHIEIIGPDKNTEYKNTYNIPELVCKPKVGDIILFNSWLPHSIPPSTFQVKEGRIAVAFNVNVDNS